MLLRSRDPKYEAHILALKRDQARERLRRRARMESNFSVTIKVVSAKKGVPVVASTVTVGGQSPQAVMVPFMDLAEQMGIIEVDPHA